MRDYKRKCRMPDCPTQAYSKEYCQEHIIKIARKLATKAKEWHNMEYKNCKSDKTPTKITKRNYSLLVR